jgi:CrcB protein
MRRALLVFVGGGLGSSLRALLLAWLGGGATAPVLLANLLGSFALGVTFVLADEAGVLRAPERLFVAVGVLGGFTTFSTFAWGTDLLLARGAGGDAFTYVVASIGGGVACVALGLEAGRELVVAREGGAASVLRRLSRRDPRRPERAQAEMGAIEAENREETA